MRLLLFDVDSVLIEPHGYHLALAETTAVLGQLLGVADARLSEAQINAFEAAGVSSEWDSAAMCLIHLLQQIWRAGGDAEIPDRLAQEVGVRTGIHAEYDGLIERMAGSALSGRPVGERAAELLGSEAGLTEDQRTESVRLMSLARTPECLPFLIFQELITGSEFFEKTYHLAPSTSTESYLKLYDLPMIGPEEAGQMTAWAGKEGNGLALFTARPGLAEGQLWMTPDAEMGAELIGLQSLPIASVGKLAWLGGILGLDEQKMVKPQAIHAMLGLLMAAGTEPADILDALRAFQSGQSHPVLRRLDGAELTVFEDSLGGILSLKNAVDRLKELGIRTESTYIGVTDLAVKRTALQSAGARVVGHISEILPEVLV